MALLNTPWREAALAAVLAALSASALGCHDIGALSSDGSGDGKSLVNAASDPHQDAGAHGNAGPLRAGQERWDAGFADPTDDSMRDPQQKDMLAPAQGSGGGGEGGGGGGGDCPPPFDTCEPIAECNLNGEIDADETGIDCGGAVCAPCGEGQNCSVSTDCSDGLECTPMQLCEKPCDPYQPSYGQCDDGFGCMLHNFDSSPLARREGGAHCEPKPETCNNGWVDGDESARDCGGNSPCGPCQLGDACVPGMPPHTQCDYAVAICVNSTCVATYCHNSIKDMDESDMDCGGSCNPCEPERTCNSGTDCDSGLCVPEPVYPGESQQPSHCAPATCLDQMKNGTESDMDCGGICGNTCQLNASCDKDFDCQQLWCDSGQCRPPSCTDDKQNGSESDKDCGGDCPTRCQAAQSCRTDYDCESPSTCEGGSCTTP